MKPLSQPPQEVAIVQQEHQGEGYKVIEVNQKINFQRE